MRSVVRGAGPEGESGAGSGSRARGSRFEFKAEDSRLKAQAPPAEGSRLEPQGSSLGIFYLPYLAHFLLLNLLLILLLLLLRFLTRDSRLKIRLGSV